MTGPVAGRVAVRCIRPDLIAEEDRARIEQEMTDLGVQLGCAVDTIVVVINPDEMGPWATVANAIARARATHVIVPSMWHVDGIDDWIRARTELLALAGPHAGDDAEAKLAMSA
ncbi:hypothetical protein [Nocardia vaccinii]|uniref:hypothetical protein n=1 Tax=Nocardia vaccinii TaxID=1822 RepID=UPI000836EF92|nr:hypothetical protein [Nocardia vaccinii]